MSDVFYDINSVERFKKENRIFLDAIEYAYQTLGNPTCFFSRIARLAKMQSIQDLKKIIYGWKFSLYIPMPEEFDSGAQWGYSRRLLHDKGIYWWMQCECGTVYRVSANDSVPVEQRRCAACQKTPIDPCRDERNQRLVEWQAHHARLVYDSVHRVLKSKEVDASKEMFDEIVSLCWNKLFQVADTFDPNKGSIVGFIRTVCKNNVFHYLRDDGCRRKHEVQLTEELEAILSSDIKPAQCVHPQGYGPDSDCQVSEYDRKVGLQWER